jgi:hypothetical protein
MYRRLSITFFFFFISAALYAQVNISKDTIVLTKAIILKIQSKRMHYFSKSTDVYFSTVTLSLNDSLRIKLIYRGQFSIPTSDGNLLYLAEDTCYLKEGNLYDIVLYKTCITESGESFYRYLALSDNEDCSVVRLQKRKKNNKNISLDYKHRFFELGKHLYKMKILICSKPKV